MKLNKHLKFAALYLRERHLDEQIKKVRFARMKSQVGSTALCTSGTDRQDLILTIPLAEYLAAYGEQESPKSHSYASSVSKDPLNLDGESISGTKQYFEYSARWVGTLPRTKPPLHVWVKAQTQSVFTPDPETTKTEQPQETATV